MPQSRILMVDAHKQEKLRIGSPTSVISSSDGAPWENCIIEYQRLPPTETPEIYMEHHLLSVQVVPTIYLNCWGEGKHYHFRFNPNDVFFNPASVATVAQWEGEAEVINIGFLHSYLAHYALENFDVARLNLIGHAGGADLATAQLAAVLQHEIASGYVNGRTFGTQLVAALTTHLLVRYSTAAIKLQTVTSGLSKESLKRLKDYIHEHLAASASSLEIDVLARVVNLSPHYFMKAFRGALGITPHQYIIRCRVERARQLLLSDPRLTVDEIAKRVGFADHSHLTRHFRRTFGVTPGQLRRL